MSDAFIENIKIQNFKSFKNLDISLNRFNVIIGANACGKSNLTQIFSFLKDITSYGLDNAISLQGGLEYLQNFNIGASKNLLFEVTFSAQMARPTQVLIQNNKQHMFSITKAIYRFEIKFEEDSEFTIVDDRWILDTDVYTHNDKKFSTKLSSGKVIISNERGTTKVDTKFSSSTKIDINIPTVDFDEQIKSKSLLIEDPLLTSYTLYGIGDFFNEIRVYDFDPKLAKRATQIKGRVELDSDGSNLSIVLKNIIENKKNRKKFSNFIIDLLPFVDSISTEKFADKSILFMLKERYFKQSLPSTLISDGTINITALILALYFQPNRLAIIDEPERNIHPSLISKIVEMMKDASRKSQVIVTTHNPEMIRYAKIENVLTVRRDEKGYSEIVRPGDQESVKNFLKNDMEIGVLYVQNLLGD